MTQLVAWAKPTKSEKTAILDTVVHVDPVGIVTTPAKRSGREWPTGPG